jgi:hypothetical protein
MTPVTKRIPAAMRRERHSENTTSNPYTTYESLGSYGCTSNIDAAYLQNLEMQDQSTLFRVRFSSIPCAAFCCRQRTSRARRSVRARTRAWSHGELARLWYRQRLDALSPRLVRRRVWH